MNPQKRSAASAQTLPLAAEASFEHRTTPVVPAEPSLGTCGARSVSAGTGAGGVAALGLSVYQSSSTSFDIFEVKRETGRLRAMRSGVLTSTRVLDEQLTAGGDLYRRALVTLTYARPGEWSAEHITKVLSCYREWARRKGFCLAYVWVAEIQEKRFHATGHAVMHYHVVLWLPLGKTPPLPDKQGWWKHGSTRAEWVRSPVGVMDYLTKYISKGTLTHLFPMGARIWGAGGLSMESRVKRAFLRLPSWLPGLFAQPGEIFRCKRAKGGGWWVPSLELWIRSPWRIDRYSKHVVLAQWVGWRPGDIEYREGWQPGDALSSCAV